LCLDGNDERCAKQRGDRGAEDRVGWVVHVVSGFYGLDDECPSGWRRFFAIVGRFMSRSLAFLNFGVKMFATESHLDAESSCS
jgi:hypothetical protein